MKQIVDGVWWWDADHEGIGTRVSSYLVADGGVVLDPMLPEEGGLDALPVSPEHVVLTNRHHYRHAARFVERFGCTVHAPETGMHEFTKGEVVEPYLQGEELPGGIRSIAIGAICPDETALAIPVAGGAVAIGDGIVRFPGDGPMRFVPDGLLGEDPAGVKLGLQEAYRKLCDEETFDTLLLAHGQPWVGGARAALLAFVG
jgi:hypothetical protein